jgi:hypothetical protein
MSGLIRNEPTKTAESKSRNQKFESTPLQRRVTQTIFIPAAGQSRGRRNCSRSSTRRGSREYATTPASMPPPLRHLSRKPRYSGGSARHIKFGIPQILLAYQRPLSALPRRPRSFARRTGLHPFGSQNLHSWIGTDRRIWPSGDNRSCFCTAAVIIASILRFVVFDTGRALESGMCRPRGEREILNSA